MASFQRAIVKFNGGRGAVLCNTCNTIVRQDFNPDDIMDKEFYCEKHSPDKEGTVTPSCGCVFCDLDLLPDEDGYHWAAKGQVGIKCTLPEPSSRRRKPDQR